MKRREQLRLRRHHQQQQQHHHHHQYQHEHQRHDLIGHDEVKKQQQQGGGEPLLTAINNSDLENRNYHHDQVNKADGYSHHQHHHHQQNQIDQYKKKRRIRRHRAAVTIQRFFRGYLGRKRAHARRKLWVDKFKCPNCGRLEQTGVYCKGCGRRIHSEKGHLKKQAQSQAACSDRVSNRKHKQQREEQHPRDGHGRYERSSSNSRRGDPTEKSVKERGDHRGPAAPSSQSPHVSHPYPSSRSQASPRRQEVVSQQQPPPASLESTVALNSIESRLLEEISALDRKQRLRIVEKQLEKDIYDLDDQLHHHHHHGNNVKITSVANKESKIKEYEKSPKPEPQKKTPAATKEKLAFGPGAKDFRSRDVPPIGVKKKINNVEGPTSPVIKKVGLKLQKKSTDDESPSPHPRSDALGAVDKLGVPPAAKGKGPVPIVLSPGYMHQFNKKGKPIIINNNNNIRQKNGDDNSSRLGSISEH